MSKHQNFVTHNNETNVPIKKGTSLSISNDSCSRERERKREYRLISVAHFPFSRAQTQHTSIEISLQNHTQIHVPSSGQLYEEVELRIKNFHRWKPNGIIKGAVKRAMEGKGEEFGRVSDFYPYYSLFKSVAYLLT